MYVHTYSELWEEGRACYLRSFTAPIRAARMQKLQLLTYNM